MSLHQKTIVITGASRGVGRAMALRFARDGANVVILAKTEYPTPGLLGTIHSVAEEVIDAGGQALPIAVDVRDDEEITEAIEKARAHFGGIDALINNAGALSMTGTLATPMKRFDLLIAVNVRATFACSQACIPLLKDAENPHILNVSPPLSMKAKWFKNSLAYSYSKYGMSMCTLGMSAEFARDRIAVNSLWPKTLLHTAAVEHHFPKMLPATRSPDIMADAAYAILMQDSATTSGNFYIDEDVLRAAGMDDFSHYQEDPKQKLAPDFYLD